MRRERAVPPFAILADPDRLGALARALGWDVPIRAADIAATPDIFAEAMPVLPLVARAAPVPGRADPANAPAILEAIERAVALVARGEAAALVTNPIAKHVLYAAGFRHPGHTEYLAALAARPGEPAPHPVMMLWSEAMAVVPVTVHLPLAEVAAPSPPISSCGPRASWRTISRRGSKSPRRGWRSRG